MKSKKYIALLCAAFVFLAGCDQNFEDINTSPYVVAEMDPPLLFANAVRSTHPGSWEVEPTIVQQFMNAYNLGATAGPNFNIDSDGYNAGKWNSSFPTSIRLLTKAIELAEQEEFRRENLISMMRIWKAYVFMTMVDTYADIPYSQAVQGDKSVHYPVYEDDEVIYQKLYEEIKIATDSLDPAGQYVTADILYRATAATNALQVAKWQKLGNSLLLRLGMRYSKVDPDKAEAIVVEAVARGVMTAVADDAYVVFNGNYGNPMNTQPRNTNAYYYYMAEPFVDKLKATRDPRTKYIMTKYTNAGNVTAPGDTALANQYGFPVGYDSETVKALPSYRGAAGTGMSYSQLNFVVMGNALAPLHFVTYSQTKLLMAEAAQRGWIAGSAQTFYEEGVRASMDQWGRYPGGYGNIPIGRQNSYLARPGVLFNEAGADPYERINTQYWISCIGSSPEAFANFRRSGFPALSPNLYNNNLNGGFVRRLPYPNNESLNNDKNYFDAVDAIGGDTMISRVFWDSEN